MYVQRFQSVWVLLKKHRVLWSMRHFDGEEKRIVRERVAEAWSGPRLECKFDNAVNNQYFYSHNPQKTLSKTIKWCYSFPSNMNTADYHPVFYGLNQYLYKERGKRHKGNILGISKQGERPQHRSWLSKASTAFMLTPPHSVPGWTPVADRFTVILSQGLVTGWPPVFLSAPASVYWHVMWKRSGGFLHFLKWGGNNTFCTCQTSGVQ